MQLIKRWLFGNKNQIDRRLIVQVVLFSSLITLCISALQLAMEYRGLRNALDRQLDRVTFHLPTIAGSVWDFDQKQVRRALDALVLLPHVAQVTITPSDIQIQWSAGESKSSNTVVRNYSLRHEVRGADTEIGKLQVMASLDGIHRQVVTSAISIVLSNGLKTFFVALFMVALIRRLITSRLEKMGNKVHALAAPATASLDDQHRPRPALPPELDELDAVDWTLDRTAEDLSAALNALAKLNAELEQRVHERTAELEAFSYSVSHDLRTPLRAIDGFSQVLLEDYEEKLDVDGQRMLHLVRTNTARMGQLIDDILQFSRMGRCRLGAECVDMEQLVRSVFEDLQGEVSGRSIELDLRQLPIARGDKVMLRQVIENLLGNAIKFTRPRALAKIEVSAQKEGADNVYCVKDNGVGFDMQYVDKLFDVFERLHSDAEFEGTGIGLAIVKRVIERHGGRVWAQSRPGEGSAICFSLASVDEG